MWNRFRNSGGGILIVGHGTRSTVGTEQLLQLGHQIHALLPELPMEAAFLELAEPTIRQSVHRLHLQNVRQIFVIPILLFEAAHAQLDIPRAVEAAAAGFDIAIAGQSPPLGTHPAVLALSEYRFQQALNLVGQENSPVLDSEGCGLAMVGRGTSYPDALAQMRRFSDLRVARNRTWYGWMKTFFFVGGTPNIDELLQAGVASPCRTIIVQPHLLFEGELVERLRAKVATCQKNSPEQRWESAAVLGADPILANVFFEIATESLTRTRVATD